MPPNPDTIVAPFDPDQIASLASYQWSGRMHPFTCGNREQHPAASIDPDGRLYPSVRGWRCHDCGYEQDWAHRFMADWTWLRQTTADLRTMGLIP